MSFLSVTKVEFTKLLRKRSLYCCCYSLCLRFYLESGCCSVYLFLCQMVEAEAWMQSKSRYRASGLQSP